MVSYTHITSCLRVINIFPFVPLLNHPRTSPINSNLPYQISTEPAFPAVPQHIKKIGGMLPVWGDTSYSIKVMKSNT